jgi:hypothetical protein
MSVRQRYEGLAWFIAVLFAAPLMIAVLEWIG